MEVFQELQVAPDDFNYFELQGTLDFTCAEKTIAVSLPDFSLLLYITFALNRKKWIAKRTFNFVQRRCRALRAHFP